MTEQQKTKMPGLDFLIFSQRVSLAKAYQEWIEREDVKDCSLSVISFLVMHDIIDTEKALNFINNGGK